MSHNFSSPRAGADPAQAQPLEPSAKGPSASTTSFGSVAELASALRRAEAAHGEHEARTGRPDSDWPEWYAAYMAAEQSAGPLPS